MIILGIILLLIGFIAKIAILWTIGIIVLVVGLILLLLGSLGHMPWARAAITGNGTLGRAARRGPGG